MEEILKYWETNASRLPEKKRVSNRLRPKTLSPLGLRKTSEKKRINSKTLTSKEIRNTQKKHQQLRTESIDVEGQESSAPKKIIRPCKLDVKAENGKVNKTKSKTLEKTAQPIESENDEDLFANLLKAETFPESDSLESDFDEERGFTVADRFLMLNQLSRELERREKIIKDITKRKHEEMEQVKKKEYDIDKKFEIYDEEIEKILREHFKDSDLLNSSKPRITKDIEIKKVIDKIKTESSSDSEDDDTDNIENLQQQLHKLTVSLEKRVKDYNLRKTEFERYFEPSEGVTDQKLHNYFLKEILSDHEDRSTSLGLESKFSESNTNVSEPDKSIDVLHPLSSEEKRKNLQKLLNDLKSDPFLQKKPLGNLEKIAKKIPCSNKLNSKNQKKLFDKENFINQFPLLEKNEKLVDSSTRIEEEFPIMLSDISTSEEDEMDDNEMERKIVKKKSVEDQINLKKTVGTVIQHLKEEDPKRDTTHSKKSGMQLLLNKVKRKQEEEALRKKEFARWFGESETKDDEHQSKFEVPGWKPGWTRLDAKLKEAILKDGWEGKTRTKKGTEGDPIEEYKRLDKEYEQLEAKLGLKSVKDSKQSGIKDISQGEKWIKIKKGTLMRDYQIRWRQGMYYLVERKHVKKKKKQKLSKKRMIRANINSTRKNKQSINKQMKKLNLKSYLGKKKDTNISDIKKKLFKKRGEAIVEIKKILAHLESKRYGDRGDAELITDSKMAHKWTIVNFKNHFKKKCQEIGLQEESDSDEDDDRGMFRKYCIKYLETKIQQRKTRLKNQQEQMYPLGLFKPKKVNDSDFEVDKEELSDNGGDSGNLCSDEEESFNEVLFKEVFNYWTTDSGISNKSERKIYKTKKRAQKTQNLEEIFGESITYLVENTKKMSKKHTIEKKSIPQSCRDQFDLHPDIYNLFFSSKPTDNIKISFGDKYLIKDKSYLSDNISSETSSSKKHSDYFTEMRKKGLIQTVDYEYLKDDEVLIPWEDIKVELMEQPLHGKHRHQKF